MNITTSSVTVEGAVLVGVGDDGSLDNSMTSDLLAPKRAAPPWPWILLWSLHFYILGAIFLALACYALYTALDSCLRPQSGPKRASSISSCILAIKVLLFVLGVTRALYMYLYLHFWYDTGKPWKVVENILSNMAYPCLTAGFGLMCQILYEASRLKAQSSSKVLASKVMLVIVIAFHFALVITAVTLIEFVNNFVLMLLLCHGFFILWGIFLIITFLIFSKTLSQAEKKSSCVLAEIKEKESSTYGVSSGANTNYSMHSIQQEKGGKIGINEDAPQITVDDVFEESESNVANTSVCNTKGVNFSMEDNIRMDDKAVLQQNTLMDPREISVKNSNRGRSSDKNTFYNRMSNMFKWTRKGLKVHSPNGLEKYSTEKQPSPVLKMIRGGKNPDKKGAPRKSYRGKLTRKVMRIANLTAFLNALCVILNTFVVLRGLAMFYLQWKMSPTALYIFNTCFRILELGLGFTMAYFTMQSIKTGSKSEKSFFKRGKKNENVTSCTDTYRYPSTIGTTDTEQRRVPSTS